ncbi:unnamed protein product [Psylliodes chrysocephalus]|uniref:Regulatory protein zeste n=1 Tax=Psylliodes chrysocephalus TaxID=3402493 RepID=A0A9P0G9Q6_9CUCU|nr:unnamed protein product [Psylliodes chrysocephala]
MNSCGMNSGGMNSSKRSSNFTQLEVSELISLMKTYQDIVECKKSDAVTWRQKEEAWQSLYENVEDIIVQPSTSTTTPRAFKRPFPKDVSETSSDDKSRKDANSQEIWNSWTPMKLKKPLSKGVSVREQQPPNRKTKLTEDCRQKIKSVSEAKLDFLRLQTTCLKD